MHFDWFYVRNNNFSPFRDAKTKNNNNISCKQQRHYHSDSIVCMTQNPQNKPNLQQKEKRIKQQQRKKNDCQIA